MIMRARLTFASVAAVLVALALFAASPVEAAKGPIISHKSVAASGVIVS